MRNHKLANTLLSFNIYLDGVDIFYQTGPYGHLTNLINDINHINLKPYKP